MNFENYLNRLDQALVATGRIVTGIQEDQWSLPSPCAGWDVRTVANHLVGGLRIFTGQLTGLQATDDHDGHDWLGQDPAAGYDDASRADAAAWRREGTVQKVFDLAFGTVPAPMALVVHLTEVLVHGLDLAVATGQEHLVDGAAASELLSTMETMGIEAFRTPGIFAAEVALSLDAPAHRRLLAYLGRELAA